MIIFMPEGTYLYGAHYNIKRFYKYMETQILQIYFSLSLSLPSGGKSTFDNLNSIVQSKIGIQNRKYCC